ncbi:MAG: hypothetical protein ACYSUP_16325 [Planctomycetota bacterium]
MKVEQSRFVGIYIGNRRLDTGGGPAGSVAQGRLGGNDKATTAPIRQ